MQTLYERLKPNYYQILKDKREDNIEPIDFTIQCLKKLKSIDSMTILCADQLIYFLDLEFKYSTYLTIMDAFDFSHIQSTNNN